MQGGTAGVMKERKAVEGDKAEGGKVEGGRVDADTMSWRNDVVKEREPPNGWPW